MTLVDSHGFMANSSVLNGCLVLDGATSRGSDDGNVGDAASGIEQTKLVNDRGKWAIPFCVDSTHVEFLRQQKLSKFCYSSRRYAIRRSIGVPQRDPQGDRRQRDLGKRPRYGSLLEFSWSTLFNRYVGRDLRG